MLQFLKIDIFKANCEAIVNPINCVGVMGGGLAKVFKERYPDMFEEYKNLCDSKSIVPGKLHVWRNPLNDPRWIINFPTKNHWKNPSEISYVVSGLKSLVTWITSNKVKSVAIPALGCGLGGLDWDVVKKIIEFELLDNATKEVDLCEIYVSEPQ